MVDNQGCLPRSLQNVCHNLDKSVITRKYANPEPRRSDVSPILDDPFLVAYEQALYALDRRVVAMHVKKCKPNLSKS